MRRDLRMILHILKEKVIQMNSYIGFKKIERIFEIKNIMMCKISRQTY